MTASGFRVPALALPFEELEVAVLVGLGDVLKVEPAVSASVFSGLLPLGLALVVGDGDVEPARGDADTIAHARRWRLSRRRLGRSAREVR